MSNWSLGEAEIRDPSKFNINYTRHARETILSSGKSTHDVKRIKKIYSLSYNSLTTEEAINLIAQYEKNEYLPFTYPKHGSWVTVNVWLRDLPLEMLNQEPEFWSTVTFILEEQ